MNAPTNPAASDLKTHIRCEACGKWFKKLGTHLRNTHGMSPGEYRSRFGVPEDQPLVAPALLAKMQRNAVALNEANDRERARHRQRLRELNGKR
jgi:predicted transcriptional regulator